MKSMTLGVILLAATCLFSQAQNDSPKAGEASAYYFYTVAHSYAEKATASRERNQEYIDKAIENYRAAITADPEAALAAKELAEITEFGRLRIQLHPALIPPRRQP